jgi:glycosyltransferase involved in cell wall biosynthesis
VSQRSLSATESALNSATKTKVGAVVIGRNEGGRLTQSLRSLIDSVALIVYVDSGSTDGSAASARKIGAVVLELDSTLPFTAARARNAGFRNLRVLAPQLIYVQFVDGDCEVDDQWLGVAMNFLDQNENVAAVCGRRRERFPERSIYNRMCDAEWDTPIGATKGFGGDVLMRVDAVEQTGGYREDLIAGEEPELCIRLRAAGWQIWRLDAEMTRHDAAMTRFSQWWRRSVRCGYAFAEGSHLHGAPPTRHWVWEARRAWLWGLCLPFAIAVAAILGGISALFLLLIYPAQILKQILRSRGSTGDRIRVGFFQVLARFPETWGEILFVRDRLAARKAQLIEYK